MSRTCRFGSVFSAWLLIGVVAWAQGSTEVDTDQDGLSDVQEQGLLERFVPRFQVSRRDCAIKPALFEEEVALDGADAKTEDALTKGAKATGGALKKSTKAVERFLHLTGEEKSVDDDAPQ